MQQLLRITAHEMHSINKSFFRLATAAVNRYFQPPPKKTRIGLSRMNRLAAQKFTRPVKVKKIWLMGLPWSPASRGAAWRRKLLNVASAQALINGFYCHSVTFYSRLLRQAGKL